MKPFTIFTVMRAWIATCCCLTVISAAPKITEKPARKYGLSNQRSGESCNPVVDILFVFDNTSAVNASLLSAQKSFVTTIIQKHTAPKGTVRIAVSLCGDSRVSTSRFTDTFTATSDFFGTTFKQTPADVRSHCLHNMNSKFKTESRDRVARIAVIFKIAWNWLEADTQVQTEVAWNENIVLVVVVIGVKDFKSLSALQNVATEDGTFFVVADSGGLAGLADSLGKDACKPISLDLTSKSLHFWNVTPQTIKRYVQSRPVVLRPQANKEAANRSAHPYSLTRANTRQYMYYVAYDMELTYEPCIDLSDGMFKRYVPGFGYTRQKCRPGHVFSFASCACIPA